MTPLYRALEEENTAEQHEAAVCRAPNSLGSGGKGSRRGLHSAEASTQSWQYVC